jgi:hypothetical protein
MIIEHHGGGIQAAVSAHGCAVIAGKDRCLKRQRQRIGAPNRLVQRIVGVNALHGAEHFRPA